MMITNIIIIKNIKFLWNNSFILKRIYYNMTNAVGKIKQ